MARVLLENVTKVFDDKVTAVNNATLEVADHEFMVIVGPSGCGKTTILRMIAGLEESTSGTITIGDRIVNDIPPNDRDITMVFQNYALYPHMTVFENMAFGLKLRKYPKAEIEKRVKEAVTLLGIGDLLNRKPKALSGGQRQRTAVGRAIVRNPKVSLFDEPLSNLDAKVRVTTRGELKALHHRLRTTSIYVTHDQSEAMILGDRICVLYKGKIQQVGSPQEVYDCPTNRFVASFIGILPMSFIEGAIQHNGNNTYFVAAGDTLLIPASIKAQLIVCGDKRAVLGMRPEHISLQPFDGQHQNSLDCLVTEVEPFGDRRNLYLKTAYDNRLIATLTPRSNIPLNRSVRFYIDVEKAHIFEPGEMGKNIRIST